MTLRQKEVGLRSLSLPLEAAFAWELGLAVHTGSLMALGKQPLAICLVG